MRTASLLLLWRPVVHTHATHETASGGLSGRRREPFGGSFSDLDKGLQGYRRVSILHVARSVYRKVHVEDCVVTAIPYYHQVLWDLMGLSRNLT